MKNIIITGGAGFIGSHVVRLFVNKYSAYRIINVDVLTYAGVSNATKNVFGMMPHPERAADAELRNEDGLELFKSMIAHMAVA